MSKEAMKLALDALERMKRYGNTFGYRSHEQNPYEQVCEAITALRAALAEQPAPVQQEPVAWRPDVCPITGLPFFMWIEHHETGQNVPTYGGPYDSYTIPVRDKDGSYCRERYDHDLGGWRTDEVEDVGIQIVSDQAYVSDDEPPASKPLTDEQINTLRQQYGVTSNGRGIKEFTYVVDFTRAIEAAHGIKEKNT